MNDGLLKLILEITLKATNKTAFISASDCVIINPIEFNLCRRRVLATCLAITAYCKIHQTNKISERSKSVHNIINRLNKIWKGNSRLAAYYKELSKYEKKCIEERLSNFYALDYSQYNLMDLYESLLSYEFYPENGKIVSTYGKLHRNRLGSYYTPGNFAKTCTTAIMDAYIHQILGISNFSLCRSSVSKNELNKIIKLLTRIKIMDFSSGTGRFLVAVVNYLKESIPGDKKDSSSKNIVCSLIKNLYAIDVDQLALEIAKIELLLLSDNSKVLSYLDKHFIHGNPLISTKYSKAKEQKEKCFDSGYIYHDYLGINLDDKRFDIIIGNPPWEKIRFEDRGFFGSIYPVISETSKKSERLSAINKISQDYPSLFQYYDSYKSNLEKFKNNVRKQDFFDLSVRGELNTYSLFTELALKYRANDGMIGLILKSAIVTSQVNKDLFEYLLNKNLILNIYDFINTKKVFNIDSRERFCYLLLGKHNKSEFYFSMGLNIPEQMFDMKLRQTLSKELLKKINPHTLMLPNVSDSETMNILLSITDSNDIFSKVYPEAKFGRIVHLTNHSSSIHKKPLANRLPIYEGKFIEQYDGKYSGFDEIEDAERYGDKISAKLIPQDKKKDPRFVPQSRFYIEIEKWNELTKKYDQPFSLMWRSLTSATNKRTCIATILPHMPTSQSIQLLQLNNNMRLTVLLALFNSVVFDYIVRAKLNAIDLTQTIIRQMPVPPIERYKQRFRFNGVVKSLEDHIVKRVCELLHNDSRLKSLCDTIYQGNRQGYVRERVRSNIVIQAELDLLIARAYNLKWAQFKEILLHFNDIYSDNKLLVMQKENELLKINREETEVAPICV